MNEVSGTVIDTRPRRKGRALDRAIAGGAIAVLVALAGSAAAYAWQYALSHPIAADRVAYGDLVIGVLLVGLLAVYPFAGMLMQLARRPDRRR